MKTLQITAVRVNSRGFVSELYCEKDDRWLLATETMIAMEVGLLCLVARLHDRDVLISGTYRSSGKYFEARRDRSSANALLELTI